jgi:RNA polymerase sigma factor (sigma-70 family)
MMKVKSGEIDQLGLLFERHSKPLFGFFYRLTNNAPVSEDLVQNVFMRILRYRHTFNGDGKFTTWMYQIARNVHIDHFRKEKKMGQKDDLIDWEKMQSDGRNAHEQLEHKSDFNLLKKAMARLNREKREALILSKFQGMKYEEIADIQDCSLSAVKVRIFRAMNELKEIVANLEKEQHYD